MWKAYESTCLSIRIHIPVVKICEFILFVETDFSFRRSYRSRQSKRHCTSVCLSNGREIAAINVPVLALAAQIKLYSNEIAFIGS